MTALYRVVKRGDSIEVRRLLSAGVDPNGAPGLATPLSAAAARGNTGIIRMLLDGGAKPDGYAVQVAAFGNHAKAVQLLVGSGWADRWATRTAIEHVEVVGIYS